MQGISYGAAAGVMEGYVLQFKRAAILGFSIHTGPGFVDLVLEIAGNAPERLMGMSCGQAKRLADGGTIRFDHSEDETPHHWLLCPFETPQCFISHQIGDVRISYRIHACDLNDLRQELTIAARRAQSKKDSEKK